MLVRDGIIRLGDLRTQWQLLTEIFFKTFQDRKKVNEQKKDGRKENYET